MYFTYVKSALKCVYIYGSTFCVCLGCEEIESCADTRYGCCKDGATVAQGLGFDGCPDSQCDETL